MIIETKRLILREMTREDYLSLAAILQDKDVMYAYDGPFSDEETHEWLERQLWRYGKYGFGLWAAVLKETGEMIGQCGLTIQDCAGPEILEVGYLFRKEYWHKGLAIEAARACRDYAFNTLEANELFSIIRDTNAASQNVAKRNGMTLRRSFIKHYRGADMPHCLFSITREEWLNSTERGC